MKNLQQEEQDQNSPYPTQPKTPISSDRDWMRVRKATNKGALAPRHPPKKREYNIKKGHLVPLQPPKPQTGGNPPERDSDDGSHQVAHSTGTEALGPEPVEPDWA